MNMDTYTDSIIINGETYDYASEKSMALVPCDNCGHINEVEVTKDGSTYTLSAFSCENCGHWNSFD